MIPLPPTRTVFLAAALLSAAVLCSFAQGDNTQDGGLTTQPVQVQRAANASPQSSGNAAAQAGNATAQAGNATAQADNATAQVGEATAQIADAGNTQTPAELFASASNNYNDGNFAAAAEQFAQLAKAHPSLAVYYNLGNANFRLGEYGHSIAAYEKARALSPTQPDVLANLNRAREAARVTPAPASHWEQYARKLTPNNWTLLLTVSFWAALALWLVPAQFRRPHGIWRPSLLSLAIVVLLLSLAGLYPWRQLTRGGTILKSDTPLLLAPVATSPVQTYAQAGQHAERIGTHGEFDRIRLPDGTEGWVAQQQFATTWKIRNSNAP